MFQRGALVRVLATGQYGILVELAHPEAPDGTYSPRWKV